MSKASLILWETPLERSVKASREQFKVLATALAAQFNSQEAH